MKISLCDSLKEHPEFSKIQMETANFYKNEDADKKATLFLDQNIIKLKSELFSTVHCDFLDKSFLKEVRQSFSRSEGVYSFLKPLSKNRRIKICDMTVGMGRDFFKFILAGHDVVGFERNPVFYYLVKDGLQRFLASPESEDLAKQFRVSSFNADLRLGDAVFGGEDSNFDLIYYDPMFDDKSKKAAPKKGMQALKHLNIDFFDDEKNEDKVDCLNKALKTRPDSLIYKCSGVSKDFPLKVKKEHKGKGFSYLYL